MTAFTLVVYFLEKLHHKGILFPVCVYPLALSWAFFFMHIFQYCAQHHKAYIFWRCVSPCFLGSLTAFLLGAKALSLGLSLSPRSLGRSDGCAVWRHFSRARSGASQAPLWAEWSVSQAVTRFTRRALVSLELHVDAVTHSSVTKAFIPFSASWFCLNNCAFRQVHFFLIRQYISCSRFGLLFVVGLVFFFQTPSLATTSYSFLVVFCHLENHFISPPFFLSFPPQG